MEHSKHNPLRVAGSAALSAVLAVGIMMPVASPTKAYADPTAADKQAEAQSVLASLNAMQEQLDTASNDYYAALEEQEQAQQKMEEAQGRIDEATDEIADLQERLGDRARSMYRNGSATILDVLLGSSSFSEFVTNWDMLDKMNQNDTDLVNETKDLRQQIEDEKAVYAEQEQIAADKAAEAKEIKDEAEATVAEMQATYDSLSAEAAELLEQERAAQEAAEQAAAQDVIDNAIENAPSNNTDNGYSEPPYNAVTGNAVVDRAYSYIGNAEYVWGACSPGAFDCSGFVAYCLTGAYSRLGTTYTFLNWPHTSNPQPGDVAVNENHCGIYIGGGQMIHCATYGVGVIIGPVQSGMVFVRY
ncbi:MAG TPA: C40 family peptidase [Candidatus Aphodovivens avistercoris]|nr:C40 family peptidase [Candidatus Aphodovivens avistercoris]